MEAYEVMNLIDEASDLIAEAQGMNVTYCESMDMSLFPVVVETITGDAEDDEDTLESLHFLAWNGRLIPEEYEDASYEEIRAYLIENQEEILEEIAGDCRNYIEEYKDCVDGVEEWEFDEDCEENQ